MSSIWVTIRKELRSIFRDRKTLITLLVFPLLIPVMIFLYVYLYESYDDETKYLIGIKAKLGNRVKGIPYEECIDLIVRSGGIPILAHPKTLKWDDRELRELIKYMKSIGLNGLEV